MPVYALARVAQAAQPDAGAGELTSSPDVVRLIAEAGPLVKVVLLVLLLFSALSWGIILYKFWAFRRAERQTARFMAVFRKSSKFSEVQAVCPGLGESPLAGDPQRPAAAATRPTLKSLDSVDRALLRATTVELSKLESRVTFLATTASLTPFIGLFGTVWGIMSSFLSISAVGSSSLQTVGPGIAEALIATAAGLFAAIPAVFFYNHFTNRVKHFSNEMDDFALEFLNISERNFT
jgi:biopolymer transport protein TolQ